MANAVMCQTSQALLHFTTGTSRVTKQKHAVLVDYSRVLDL
jgi:hypothetical protein